MNNTLEEAKMKALINSMSNGRVVTDKIHAKGETLSFSKRDISDSETEWTLIATDNMLGLKYFIAATNSGKGTTSFPVAKIALLNMYLVEGA